MKLKVLSSFLSVVSCLVINTSLAQSARPLHLEELPQSFISGVVQDKEGFIWMSTRNGIARYDGKDLKTFKSVAGNMHSLASNIVTCLKKDNAGNLVVEYESGAVDVLDPGNEKVEHIVNEDEARRKGMEYLPRGWVMAAGSNFWSIAKPEGLNHFGPAKKLQRYTRSEGLQSNIVRGLLEDKKGRLWILTQKGLCKFDSKARRFRAVANFDLDIRNPESNGDCIDLHERRNGELMWGDNSHLFFFDPKRSSLRKTALNAHSKVGLKWIQTSPDGDEFFHINDAVYCYSEKHGVRLISSSEEKSIGSIASFLVDRSGVIWLGTNKTGIYQIDLSNNFKTAVYKGSFAIDVIGTQLGTPARNFFKLNDNDEIFAPSGYNIRSAYDRKGLLYIAMKQTVAYYDPEQNKLVALPGLGKSGGSLGIPIKGITFGKGNEPIVIQSNGTVLIYDKTVLRWKVVIESVSISKIIGDMYLIMDCYADPENLWISTAESGLLIISLRTFKITHISKGYSKNSLPSNNLLAIEPDPHREDVIWIGSYHGLVRLEKKSLHFKNFEVKEGLPDNTIYDIQADRSGFLWLSSNRGLCRFDPVSLESRTFTNAHGLQENEFNRFHSLKLPDGRIAFGGIKGWALFDPLAIRDDNFNTPVVLTSLKINNNKDIRLKNNNDVFSRPINNIAAIDLAYSENTISLSFAGLEFDQPEDLQYRYQLEGFDKEWIHNGNTNEAIYTKIPPGEYTFKVNASNSTGKWSSAFKTMGIVIHPPWWRTIAAYMAYVLLLGLSIVLFIRYRLRQGLIRQDIILKEKETIQLKELDVIKNQFFENITHEFRTPLTLISGPAEQLMKHPGKEEQDRLVAMISRNAAQLLQLTNQLMDLAKLEAKAMKPKLTEGDVIAEIAAVVEVFKEEAISKDISMTFEHVPDTAPYLFSSEMLERLSYNLISNAVKFTPRGGTINVALSEKEAGISVVIRDSGPGIPAAEIPYIYDRFYQANNEMESSSRTRQPGTGIGLALVKELIDLQHGTIDVQNCKDSTGAVFSIFLPYEKARTAANIEINLEELDAEEEDGLRLPVILLVEDNDELASFIQASLSTIARIIRAANGLAGLNMALDIMPDLVISDVLMPEMDGFTLCGRLKQDERTSHIPVILLTAKADFESKIQGLTHGADDYLTKPFHVSELLLRVGNHLEQQKRFRDYIQANLAQLPENIGERTEIQNLFLDKFYGIIEDHLENPLFGVEEMVHAINISRTSLHRKVKAITGMTTTEIIRAYKLKRATEFLIKGYNISETADKTGFNSPSYFTKSFKDLYQITPSEYVKKYGG